MDSDLKDCFKSLSDIFVLYYDSYQSEIQDWLDSNYSIKNINNDHIENLLKEKEREISKKYEAKIQNIKDSYKSNNYDRPTEDSYESKFNKSSEQTKNISKQSSLKEKLERIKQQSDDSLLLDSSGNFVPSSQINNVLTHETLKMNLDQENEYNDYNDLYERNSYNDDEAIPPLAYALANQKMGNLDGKTALHFEKQKIDAKRIASKEAVSGGGGAFRRG